MSKVSVSLEAYNELNKVLDDYYKIIPHGTIKLRVIQAIYNEEVKLKTISPEEAVKAISLGFEVMSKEEQFLNKIEEELNGILAEKERLLSMVPIDNKSLKLINDRIYVIRGVLKIWKEIYAPSSKAFTK
ncbi:hypothetical protein 019DV002_67 [Bacillus phage 019DV002]|uniref:Uncharacterized protein n=1 Tax=Bacillus phage 019DV002 TaxID=2601653 RepID=A0A5J6T439_9CAUD|nr:hypothetical protein 019DV002_67 [Bacillus phage 019DV002]QFG05294.1 hypothetical protein 019DV004_67 [Bacillus phage 019DV004]